MTGDRTQGNIPEDEFWQKAEDIVNDQRKRIRTLATDFRYKMEVVETSYKKFRFLTRLIPEPIWESHKSKRFATSEQEFDHKINLVLLSSLEKNRLSDDPIEQSDNVRLITYFTMLSLVARSENTTYEEVSQRLRLAARRWFINGIRIIEQLGVPPIEEDLKTELSSALLSQPGRSLVPLFQRFLGTGLTTNP